MELNMLFFSKTRKCCHRHSWKPVQQIEIGWCRQTAVCTVRAEHCIYLDRHLGYEDGSEDVVRDGEKDSFLSYKKKVREEKEQNNYLPFHVFLTVLIAVKMLHLEANSRVEKRRKWQHSQKEVCE